MLSHSVSFGGSNLLCFFPALRSSGSVAQKNCLTRPQPTDGFGVPRTSQCFEGRAGVKGFLHISPDKDRLDEIDEQVGQKAYEGFYESRLAIELGMWEKGEVIDISEFRGVNSELYPSYHQCHAVRCFFPCRSL